MFSDSFLTKVAGFQKRGKKVAWTKGQFSLSIRDSLWVRKEPDSRAANVVSDFGSTGAIRSLKAQWYYEMTKPCVCHSAIAINWFCDAGVTETVI